MGKIGEVKRYKKIYSLSGTEKSHEFFKGTHKKDLFTLKYLDTAYAIFHIT